MTAPQYVLCTWKRRLWPAKVLARTKASTKNKRKKEFFLDIQILSLEEKIQVRSSRVKALRRSQIEGIAASLASQHAGPAAAVEELTYRRSLRVALDILNESPDSCPAATWPGREAPPAEPSPPALPRPEVQTEPACQSPSGPAACEEEPGCTVDPKAGYGESTDAGGLLVPSAGDRAPTGRVSGVSPKSRRGRSAAQRPAPGRQDPPSLPEGAAGKWREEEPGGWPAPSSAPRVREEDPCARAEGLDPGLPSGSLTALPARPGARGRPAKRPRLDGVPRRPAAPEPHVHMALRSAGRPGPAPAPQPAARTGPRPLLLPGGPEGDWPSSEGSAESHSVSPLLEGDEDDEEPPPILLYHEPRSFEVGMLVWLKYHKYPFWPAVVKSVRRRDRKASVLFIEGSMDPRGKGITVCLRRLKHFDCKEKQALLSEAREDFEQAIGWCVSLITDYRVRLGCGSFSGSFLEYYAADISYPVRKSIQQDALGTQFPQLSSGDPEEPAAGTPLGQRQPCRKVLPDRSRAARDRANQRLVEHIVRARGAEEHLQAVLRGRTPSRWLQAFLSAGRCVTCLETYLEDEGQLDLVVQYLQGVYQGARRHGGLAHIHGDRVRFILDVLLPEAIISAIAAVDGVDYRTAEEKYLQGPSLSYREKELFDSQLLEERSRRRR